MKIVGYIFLIAGFSLMVCGLYDGYAVFKGLKEPPNIFKETIKKTSTAVIDVPLGGQNIKIPLSGLEEALPSSNKIFDLTIEFFLVSIFLSAGYKISILGTNLIKKV